MRNIFVILGYGIPKDILKDEPSRRYLSLIFNSVYRISLEKKDKKPIIIFTGGHSDIFRPFKRAEAAAMKKLFLFFAHRPFIKEYTKDWCYKTETQSLSTLENLINSYKIIKKIKGPKRVYVFCEFTRANKIKIFTRRIIKNNFQIIPIDFDLSLNRYLNSKFINKRESVDIKLGLRALRDKKFYSKYRSIFRERIKFLRKAGVKHHPEAVKKWWELKLQKLSYL